MTTVTLTSSESRHSKALALLANSGQWLRDRQLRSGHVATGIPSQRIRGLYHWTDGRTCSCADFRRRQQACKHVTAYRLDRISRGAEPQPASVVVDGLRSLLEQRAQRYDDIFSRFDDTPSPTRRSHGVIPAHQIVRED